MDQENSKKPIQVTDRRFWVVNDQALDDTPPQEEKFPSFVEELRARADLAETKLRQRLDQLAEENEAYRARLRADLERRTEARIAQILSGFLEILDNFERALETARQGTVESIQEGLRLNIQLFLTKLKGNDIVPLDILNQPFDPEKAEAIGTIPVTDPELDGVVLDELQRAYACRDQLLRPARVRIGRYQGKS